MALKRPTLVKPNHEIKAVIYVRLSRYQGDADPSTSPQRQREACEAHCKAQGWTVVEIIDIDLDVSGYVKGKRLDRPGIKRMIELLPEVDRVVFLKIDRLARSVKDFYSLVELTYQHNAALVSVKDNLDFSTAPGRFFATILSAFAEMESATISERVKDAKAYLASAGRYSGGEIPTGFRSAPNPAGNGRVLEHDPVWAPRIREAAKAVLDDNKSLYQVAKEWTALRSDGEMWTSSNVKRVLLSDAVCGRQTWPAILDADTVRRLRAKFPGGVPRDTRRKAGRLLSGLMKCSGCKGPLQVGPNGKGISSYSCRGPGCPGRVSVKVETAETMIETWFLDKYGDDSRVQWIEEAIDDHDTEIIIKAGILETTDAMADGGDTNILVPRLLALRAQLAEVQATPMEIRRRGLTGPAYRTQWAAGDNDARRMLLTEVVERIVLLPGVPGRRTTFDRFDIQEVPEDEA